MRKFLEEYINKELRMIVISGARSSNRTTKIKIRPVLIQNRLKFQCAETRGAQEFHSNYDALELTEKILQWMEHDFGQLQLDSALGSGLILVSKKGKVTIKNKRCMKPASGLKPDNLSHNRKKRYILEEGKPVEFLVDLGVMTKEGKVVHARYDKFRQINRFLEFIEDVLPQLEREREVTILDFGCGKSYLTFAMYHYLHLLRGYDVRIIGLDLKTDVIMHCNELAEKYHYDKLQFYPGDIAAYEGVSHVDMVVTLHACDTATDYALAKAVSWGATVILSVPCCQHELNKQIKNDMLSPILKYGILKERFAALVTDGLRAQLLEEAGYETQILEFIDMEHTPKNLLIRAVKTPKAKENKMLDSCMEQLHVKPVLAGLLRQQKEEADEEIFD